MQLGMIGLGRMGANMVRRLLRQKHTCVVNDSTRQAIEELAQEGATPAFSREEFVQKLADLVGADLVPIGSAGAKISAVLTGEVEAYVHAGGQYEWDSAAPVAVALACGAHASRIDGSPLVYNQGDPSLPDILVSLPGLAPTLLAGIRDLHR